MASENYQPFTPDPQWIRQNQYQYLRYQVDGVDYYDVIQTLARISQWEDWCREWSATARYHEDRGQEALRMGNTVTAGDAFLRASMCYHFGQIFFFNDLEQKGAAQAKKVETYQKGMAYFSPPAERVEVPFRSFRLPGYLRLAPGVERGPCLVFAGGLDSTKEDAHFFENLCLRRGVSTLSFDGPGQGETWAQCKMGEGFEEAVSAVVDSLQGRPEVDPARIGFIGRSMGGYYAPRAAARDSRLKACVCWGAVYDVSHWEEMERQAWAGALGPQIFCASFRHVYGARDLKEAAEIARSLSLEGVMKDVKCPLFVVHGKLDHVIPYPQAERMAREAAGPVDLDIGKDCIHCCHNRHYRCQPMMADWVAKTL